MKNNQNFIALLLNPLAAAGKAALKWKKISNLLNQNFILIKPEKNLELSLADAFQQGTRQFIAAGGDGTVNALLNTLLKTFNKNQLQEITLGAIGLGSSNDFHKPIDSTCLLKKIPLLMNFKKTIPRDILELTLDGNKYFAFLNASCGITAQANATFNHPGCFLHFLKKSSIPLAILYASIQSILCHKNRQLQITHSQKTEELYVTNIGIVKSPHFAGNFSYGFTFNPDDGTYRIQICENMNLKEKFQVLFGIIRHQFLKYAKTRSLILNETETFKISSTNPFALEYDGEVQYVTEVCVKLIKNAISCCTPGIVYE